MRTFFLAVATIFSVAASAHPGVCDFPKAPFRIEAIMPTGISKTSYDRVMDRVERIYTPIFRAAGCEFVLHRSWSDGEVNAQAWKTAGKCHVEMFGGMARYPGMTANGLAMVAAHEVGHHLGGYPYYPFDNMSDEGQSDYYAAKTGMPTLGLAQINAARALADVLADLNGEPKTSLPGPPLPEVSRTYHGHPAAQCRRVTYDAGRRKIARPRCWFKS